MNIFNYMGTTATKFVVACNLDMLKQKLKSCLKLFRSFDPVPEVKKGMYLSALGVLWLIYTFLMPFHGLVTGVFLFALIWINKRKF